MEQNLQNDGIKEYFQRFSIGTVEDDKVLNIDKYSIM
jgi:hypothetical protein